ncbi:hypothetical protein CPB83DRAFT_839458 [Crepidotus variabilis]|uniref:Uncharacterized protein n=1 Tax=Crepidotus variabilis TaxID=179855 RepID=A0A9P6E7K2_9AGAR|nr:hypothetical protein CPB83DRAFT_839458 [Crepidotus variabilis]
MVSKFTSIIAVVVLALAAQISAAPLAAEVIQERDIAPNGGLTNAKRMALGLPLNPPTRRDPNGVKPPPHPSHLPPPPPPPPPPKPTKPPHWPPPIVIPIPIPPLPLPHWPPGHP